MRGVDTLHNYLPYPWAIYSLLMDLSIWGGGGGGRRKKKKNTRMEGRGSGAGARAGGRKIKKDKTAGESLDKHVV